MKRKRSFVWAVLALAACVTLFVLAGCEGSDARKSVTGTVEELVGKKAVDAGERMKEDIDRSMKEEARRILQMGERPPDESRKQGDGEDGTGGQGE